MAYTGYRMYRGVGGLGSVDFATVVGASATGVGTITVTGAGHAAGTTYTYVLRPVVVDLETPDYSCTCEVVMDGDADWLGNRPAAAIGLTAEPIAAGEVRLRWHYATPRGGSAPNDFGIYYSTSSPASTSGSPNATKSYTTDGYYSQDVTLADGTTYYFAVTARTSGGVESSAVTAGPVVADSTAPDAPPIYTSAAFDD